jgi:Protein of unknown function (DUF3592)
VLRVRLWGPRSRVLVFLVFGSVFVVVWKWDSLSWHARGMILAAYGVVCLGAGLIPAKRARELLKIGAQAQGTVVDVKESRGGYYAAGTTYAPVVQFTALDGRTVEFTSAVGTSRSPDIGNAVPVRYRPDDPEQAEIDSASMWMLPASFGLAGGLGLLVVAAIVYSSHVSTAVPAPTGFGAKVVPAPTGFGAKVVPAPSGFTLSQPTYVHNGPMGAADFNQYWGDPTSYHFVRGYDVAYDSNDFSTSIEVILFQFATPADAAAFKGDYDPGVPVNSKADPVIPGADDYDSTSPDQGTYTHGVIATKGNQAFVIEDTTSSAARVPLVETMARRQYAAL